MKVRIQQGTPTVRQSVHSLIERPTNDAVGREDPEKKRGCDRARFRTCRRGNRRPEREWASDESNSKQRTPEHRIFYVGRVSSSVSFLRKIHKESRRRQNNLQKNNTPCINSCNRYIILVSPSSLLRTTGTPVETTGFSVRRKARIRISKTEHPLCPRWGRTLLKFSG